MPKYTLETVIKGKSYLLWKHNRLEKTKSVMACFYNHHDAQKVCDLLNETSRSQGKF